MKSAEKQLKDWSNTFANPPNLSQEQTIAVSLVGAVFLVMAVLQIAGFNEFKDSLTSIGVSSSVDTWAVVVVIAEVWAALGFLKIKLNGLIRFFSSVFAVFAATFWLVASLWAVTGTNTGIENSGFFGKYLIQQPGWWTVVEVSVLFFWVVYALKLSKK